MSQNFGAQSLRRVLRSSFSPDVVFRGAEYFKLGRVTALRISEQGATASVVGTELYSTALDWTNLSSSQEIGTHCNCRYSYEGFFCKHLWALIVALDVRSVYPLEPEATEVRLVMQNEHQDPAASHDQSGGADEEDAHLFKSPSDWRAAFKAQHLNLKGSTRTRLKQNIFITLAQDHHDKRAIKLRFFATESDASGKHLNPRPLPLPHRGKIDFGDTEMRSKLQLIAAVSLGEQATSYSQKRYGYANEASSRVLSTASLRPILASLIATGNVFASKDDMVTGLLGSDERRLSVAHFGPLKLKVGESEAGFQLDGEFSLKTDEGTEEVLAIQEISLFAEPNLYINQNRLGYIDLTDSEQVWVDELGSGPLKVPHDDAESFLEALCNQPLDFELPASLKWERALITPTARVQLRLDKEERSGRGRHLVELRLQYGPVSVAFTSETAQLVSGEERKIYARDRVEEQRLFATLPLELVKIDRWDTEELHSISSAQLLNFVQAALKVGLPVHVEDSRVQMAQGFQFSVSSGLDWFDVGGLAEFSGRWVKVPAILDAVAKGENFVPLEDGSIGLIGDEVQKRIEKLAAFAESGASGLRFAKTQGLILHSLLEGETELSGDAGFQEFREKVQSFSGINASEPVETFSGELRQYQKEGLGWLKFLETFGLGGVLADDMGLGKTIQCLAFLEERRLARPKRGSPSLLLAPKSLLQNWQAEARNFTPKLKVLVHAGLERDSSPEVFKKYDLVVATYQTMLRDLEVMKDVEWDCIVLDEAQAIKNPNALIAKATKMLGGKFRLAMTGTPIENSIQDLFSISDFVNPGFLHGKRTSGSLKISDEARESLGRAFKPIVLRRTKDQVLKDLPEKTEQFIYVELEANQLKIYNQLKRFYQSQLLKDVGERGVKRSQIQILAALTRLRQAALHPGLIDPSQVTGKSAKFEVLFEMLEEALAEGHRVLIFSQFTSLLNLLGKEMAAKQILYSYLDGKTARRQQVIDDFKTNNHPVFLMSLKAGGVGLNLVEADYVFLLDPWWNPAVEAQAIDRVHRIGQKRAVNAYRFVAKNTVEEKILDLQNTKRGIAAGILGENTNIVRSLSAQDLESILA